jgi:hypothetical protein
MAAADEHGARTAWWADAEWECPGGPEPDPGPGLELELVEHETDPDADDS